MSSETFDSRELRQALGAFVTGVTVITTVDEKGDPHGLTANSFSSVSLNPPLILWSQSVTAGSYPVFRDAERFAVNILAEGQIEISNRFAKGGHDKFSGVNVKLGLAGIPLIEGCSGYLECRKMTSYPGGDHAVFLGSVERIDFTSRKPLVFGGGKYLVAHPHELGVFSAGLGVSSLAHLQAVRIASPVLAELSNELGETLALAVWGSHGPTVIRWEESKRPVSLNLRTGLVVPVVTSATGLVFAAYLPRELTGSFIEVELTQAGATGNAKPPKTMDELEHMLREVRAHGLGRVVANATLTEMYEGAINAVSAPVFDSHGSMVLALTVIGHAGALDADWEAPVPSALKQCAESLSRRLGFRGRMEPAE